METDEPVILPIALTLSDRTGFTLWAPPWEDEDGDEWQGFLGDGAKILLYPTADELADFVNSGVEHDLSDHPGIGSIEGAPARAFEPADEDYYILDSVYELAAGEPDPVAVSDLANVVDMVSKIADSCDDGKLRGTVNRPEFADLLSDDVSFQGRDGRKRWDDLGAAVADSWDRVLERVESWLEWVGEFPVAVHADETENAEEADEAEDDLDDEPAED